MGSDIFRLAAEFFEAFGPYAIVVFLGWAYWKKDQQLQKMHARVIALSEQQTTASLKMEVAVNSLKDLINILVSKLSR